ncbi:MAG: SDR family oxidoreductase [Paracoccaceae bacterium]
MTQTLSGKVALVTGAASGMGAAIARRLAHAGAQVIAADRAAFDTAPLPGCRHQHLDVTDEASWQETMASIEATEGRLDILVNNAGVLRVAPLPETTREMFDEVVSINQTGVFLGMKAAFALLSRQGGSIVNMSSTAGLKAAANHVAYVASKFAVHGMTKVAAIEFGPHGIRVNSIHPGLIDTPMVQPFHPAGVAAFAPRQLLDHIGQPQDVAEMVAFLASDAARFSTGAEFICDGGYLTGGR